MSEQDYTDAADSIAVETVLQSTQKAKYLARQKESFEFIGGGPAGWREAPLSDIHYERMAEGITRISRLDFEIPPNYRVRAAWSERTGETPDDNYCQLCGWSPLKNHWPILNDERKLVMNVGSECVENFMGAGYLTKRITTFKMNKLRTTFESWIAGALREIDEKHGKPRHRSVYDFVERRTIWKDIPGQVYLPEPYFKFKSYLTKIVPTHSSSRKLVNAFRKARNLGLFIPEGIMNIIGIEDFPRSAGARKDDVVEQQGVEQEPSVASAPAPSYRLMSEGGKMYAEHNGIWYLAEKVDGRWVPTDEPKLPAAPVKSAPKLEQKYPLSYHDGQMFVKTNDGEVEAQKNSDGIWEPIPGLAPRTDVDLATITVGIYELPNGEIYVVKPNKDKSRQYAEKLVESSSRETEQGTRVDFDFKYEKGAIYKLRPAFKMPFEKAKALTIKYGKCLMCGHKLKAAVSVERGIGPVCVRNMGGQLDA